MRAKAVACTRALEAAVVKCHAAQHIAIAIRTEAETELVAGPEPAILRHRIRRPPRINSRNHFSDFHDHNADDCTVDVCEGAVVSRAPSPMRRTHLGAYRRMMSNCS